MTGRWALFALLVAAVVTHAADPLRPPAVPLVTADPFLSVWSQADRLTDDVTRHWTRREQPLVSLIRIDGQPFRLMGTAPAAVPALPQTGLEITPLHSRYHFEDGHVDVTLTFLTAALPDDLDVLARPLSYLTWTVRATDGKPHTVQLFDSTCGLLTVNAPNEPIVWERQTAGPLTLLRAGTQAQPVLGSSGDDHRIDWGYVYAAAPTAQSRSAMGAQTALTERFAADGSLPAADDTRQPRPANDDAATLAFTFDLGTVGAEAVTRQVIVAYDEIGAIKYYGKRLLPYWSRKGATPADLLTAASRDYATLVPRCDAFDRDVTADATRLGGAAYAQLCALAYRQALAACGLAADAKGQPLYFTKENTSNGDIATVDVIFPMHPILLAFSPTLAKASLVSVLDYAASPRWKFPNAPHDLGTYPLVFGRDDGGEGMPVEESGNMLLLCDAICQIERSPAFVAKWWPSLTRWAQYLEKYGLDPENQLCTDDFMGHLAHNANLSVKAILGLAAYGDLCRQRGDAAGAARYAKLAKDDAAHWMQVAAEGDHYRLAFDKPGTWSQKYNLVWDRILGLNVFPPEVARKEVAHYKAMLQRYGVPLDSRTRLTKTDWTVWSATMAETQADFEAIVSPTLDYLNHTTAREALADSYVTDSLRQGGMHARPVVGGVFIKFLSDRATWAKWAGRDKAMVGPWAPLPEAPIVKVVVPTAQAAAVTWRYTTDKPAADWAAPKFDDSGWKAGPAGFGAAGTPGAVVRTDWHSGDIWLRRQITIPAGRYRNLQFLAYHDEDVEIYVDGVLAASDAGYTTSYVPLELTKDGAARLKPGSTVTVAVHCHQTLGGQGVDVGLADVTER